MPHQIQVKTFTSHELIYHQVSYWFFFDLISANVYI